MTFPIVHTINRHTGFELKYLQKWNGFGVGAMSFLTAFDLISTITCLVIGILGAMSMIPMPPSVTYALFGISGAIVLSWIGLLSFNKAYPERSRDQAPYTWDMG